ALIIARPDFDWQPKAQNSPYRDALVHAGGPHTALTAFQVPAATDDASTNGAKENQPGQLQAQSPPVPIQHFAGCDHGSNEFDRAFISVQCLPAQRIFFDGAPTCSSGSLRKYYTPLLRRNTAYHYQIKAEQRERGKTVTAVKTIEVLAGHTVYVDLVP